MPQDTPTADDSVWNASSATARKAPVTLSAAIEHHAAPAEAGRSCHVTPSELVMAAPLLAIAANTPSTRE